MEQHRPRVMRLVFPASSFVCIILFLRGKRIRHTFARRLLPSKHIASSRPLPSILTTWAYSWPSSLKVSSRRWSSFSLVPRLRFLPPYFAQEREKVVSRELHVIKRQHFLEFPFFLHRRVESREKKKTIEKLVGEGLFWELICVFPPALIFSSVAASFLSLRRAVLPQETRVKTYLSLVLRHLDCWLKESGVSVTVRRRRSGKSRRLADSYR